MKLLKTTETFPFLWQRLYLCNLHLLWISSRSFCTFVKVWSWVCAHFVINCQKFNYSELVFDSLILTSLSCIPVGVTQLSTMGGGWSGFTLFDLLKCWAAGFIHDIFFNLHIVMSISWVPSDELNLELLLIHIIAVLFVFVLASWFFAHSLLISLSYLLQIFCFFVCEACQNFIGSLINQSQFIRYNFH